MALLVVLGIAAVLAGWTFWHPVTRLAYNQPASTEAIASLRGALRECPMTAMDVTWRLSGQRYVGTPVTAWQRSVGTPVTAYEARWGIPRACSDEMKALATRAADDVALDGQRRAYSSSGGLQATKPLSKDSQ